MAGNGLGCSSLGATSIRIQCVSYATRTAFVGAGVNIAAEEGPFNHQAAYGSSISKDCCFIRLLGMSAKSYAFIHIFVYI